MRANRRLRVVHRRGGWAPTLVSPDRVDQVEIVEIETAETVFLWDVPGREAGGLLRELRADLAGLEFEDFLAKWAAADED